MPSKTQSILLGGLIVGLLSTSVLGLLNLLCCAGVIIGAMVAVWHYTSTHSLTISAGQGVLMGVLAAVLGAIISAVLNYLLALAGLDITTALTIRAYESFGLPQEQIDMIRQQAENQGLGQVLMGLGISAVLYAIAGAIGGAIGASVFKQGGDTPGGGPSGGGGPQEPRGGRPAPSGPQARTPRSAEPETRAEDSGAYRPSHEEEPARR